MIKLNVVKSLTVIVMALFIMLSAGCAIPKSRAELEQKMGIKAPQSKCANYYGSQRIQCEQNQVKITRDMIESYRLIFANLKPRDQKKVTKAKNTSVVTGKEQTYKNPQTKVVSKSKVTKTETTQKEAPIAVNKNRVKELPKIELIGKQYKGSKTIKVRNGPGNEYKVVETIAKGKKLNVVGKVAGKDWYLVSKNNVANGYVHISGLKKVKSTRVAKEEKPTLPKEDKNVEIQTAKVETECRTVVTEITDGDNKGTEEATYCIGPDGAYTI